MRDTHCRRWALVLNDHTAKFFSDRVVDNNVFVRINTNMYIGKCRLLDVLKLRLARSHMSVIAMPNWSVRVSELAGTTLVPDFAVIPTTRKMEGSGTGAYVFQVSCNEKFHSPQPQPAPPHYRPQEVSLEV